MTTEFDLISRYFAPLAGPGGLGLKDDAALINSLPGKEFVVTADAFVAGVHFLSSEKPGVIARRLLRTNISDLAAKGARLSGYLLTLALPNELNEDWVAAFSAGLMLDQEEYGISLLGGDTVSTSGPIVASITAIGTVLQGSMIPRSGARVGDDLWVTGSIGDAGLGLKVVQGQLPQISLEDRSWLSGRFSLPTPPAAFGAALGERGLAHASADVSDGLVADAGHIAKASGVRLKIDGSSVPLSDAVTRAISRGLWTISEAVTAGDDYQIVFSAPNKNRDLITTLAVDHSTSATRIGSVVEGAPGVELLSDTGQQIQLTKTGFQHR